MTETDNSRAPAAGALIQQQQPTDSPNKSADPHNRDTSMSWWPMDPNWIIAILTFVIAIASVLTWRVYKAIHDSAITIERAYVTMSHKPPGVEFSRVPAADVLYNPTAQQDVSINLSIRNFGNTPAKITAALFHFIVSDGPLAVTPSYDHALAKVMRVSLVKDDNFNMFVNTPLPADSVAQIKGGSLKLHAIGYVDYMDKFGRRHRASYARVYEPSIDERRLYTKPDTTSRLPVAGLRVLDADAFDMRSNLPFVTQPGYNYDRERKKGEGNDWNDPEQP